MSRHDLPDLGFGLGLRPRHYAEILDGAPPAVDWFEAISENYMVPGGRPIAMLERVRERWPVVLHGVSLSIGSTEKLDRDYLGALDRLIRRIEPAWVSDHLCFTGAGGINTHDLLPLPYTDESLRHVARRIGEVQDFLGRRILIENPSSYVSWTASTLGEAEFLALLAREADCLLLLDVNNVFVSSFNHGFDPVAFIDGVPAERVVQFHMAGHTDHETHRVDTHDQPVCEEVWALYEHARRRCGDVSAMIERDDNYPPLAELLDELQNMRDIDARISKERALSAA